MDYQQFLQDFALAASAAMMQQVRTAARAWLPGLQCSMCIFCLSLQS